MFAVPRVIARTQLGRQAVRSFAANPFGGDAWRTDKNAFKTLILKAASGGAAPERRELFGYLAISFGDVDADKDGFITPDEFDELMEKVASLPRRFGMAPSWILEFGGDLNKRTASRRAMFDGVDSAKAGKIGLTQFIEWAYGHIFLKAKTIDFGKVDLAHLGQYTKADFLEYMEIALKDPTSGSGTTLYNFLLTVFVTVDESNSGKIDASNFDALITAAAETPRFFGLAPLESNAADRKAIFDLMDDTKSGHVTFRKFLKWTFKHALQKIDDNKAGLGYVAPWAAE